MTLPVDTDILRMKVARDVEARHRAELETSRLETERALEQFYEARRVAEVLRAQTEAAKTEGDKELRDVKERHRQEI
jgi:hypothetical protein